MTKRPIWGVGDKTQGDGYKNLDLALMDFAGGVDPSENLVWFRPDQIGVYNWSGFDSPEFETQLPAARRRDRTRPSALRCRTAWRI